MTEKTHYYDLTEAIEIIERLKADRDKLQADLVKESMLKTVYKTRFELCSTWIKPSDKMPESGIPVLADVGKKYPVRADWVAKFSEESGCDYDGDCDYNESNDTYYIASGWYEWCHYYDETKWFVNDEVLAWMPLPECEPRKETE